MWNRLGSRMAMLILSLLITVNGLTTYAPDQTSANSASSSSVSIQDILSRFSTTEAFVQQQLNSGLELEEIYLIFFHAKINQMNYEEAYEMLYPEEINLSSEVESETINEVTELAEKLQGYTVVEEETEENSENSSELNSLEGRSNAQSIQTQQEPILEQPLFSIVLELAKHLIRLGHRTNRYLRFQERFLFNKRILICREGMGCPLL